MTWIKWSAVDQYKSTLPPSIVIPSPSKLARTTTPPPFDGATIGEPITPPHEAALAITRSRNTTPIASTSLLSHDPTTTITNPPTTIGEVPKTPSRKIIVPGQPRKTPGKSKHSVADPETRPDSIAKLVLVTKEGMEMEVDSLPPGLVAASGGAGTGEVGGGEEVRWGALISLMLIVIDLLSDWEDEGAKEGNGGEFWISVGYFV